MYLYLQETISSLQQIINKKEVTIERYKVMLQESNTEYGQLLEKFHSLERSKEKIPTPRYIDFDNCIWKGCVHINFDLLIFHLLIFDNDLSGNFREPLAESKSVSILMEKWIERVHGLETEINNLTHRLIEATNHLETSKKEIEYWKNLVTRFFMTSFFFHIMCTFKKVVQNNFFV